MTLELAPASASAPTAPARRAPTAAERGAARDRTLTQAAVFPRLRYMGSKYRLLPELHDVFASVGGRTALDAFSGSGVVSYLLKASGFAVTSNDFLTFPGVIARATVANDHVTLDAELVETICGPPADDRDFIRSTFDGVYFDRDDLAFLDSAWSHIDALTGAERDLALSALVLSAARKQPRGVFTYTGARYDDGRRDLRLTMAEHFRERAAEYNATVMAGAAALPHRVSTLDALELSPLAVDDHPYDVVYLDPPYAPPRDDADYIKRYHFLEGLSVYWRDRPIMPDTKTKKLEKKYTPFAYGRSVEGALDAAVARFDSAGAVVLSSSSNALPGAERIEQILRSHRADVELHRIGHTYSFGTHSAARRTNVDEYLFVARHA
ncbi:DNA adenine methylase [Frigoribacterium sp. 2-23]|uniref:DNA adenine methylase n=1 Tax=Frigoribacterium sp. 2-23 TaxID=3415006 RepID=UPI003C6FF295